MKVLISGYGKMGRIIEKELLSRNIEFLGHTEDVCSTDPALARECVCVDFTTPEAFRQNYRFIAEHFKAAVVGTTGWDDIRSQVTDYFASKGTTLIYASNFSLGVNALYGAAQKVSSMLKGAGYNALIEETHHIHKLDAPSGTAKVLGGIVEESLGEVPQIKSFREGEVPGIHTLTLTSSCDRLTLTHEAFSREGLAKGAVAAVFMTESIKGVHNFGDLL